MYSVGPTLLALGPRCGRQGCDVEFPHPRVTWRFEWLSLKCCWHVLSLGRVWWEWCDGVCLLLWCDYLLCGLRLFPAVVFCCCMSFVRCRWCRLSRSCLAVACMFRPCVYLACLTSLHTSFLPNLPLLFQ